MTELTRQLGSWNYHAGLYGRTLWDQGVRGRVEAPSGHLPGLYQVANVQDIGTLVLLEGELTQDGIRHKWYRFKPRGLGSTWGCQINANGLPATGGSYLYDLNLMEPFQSWWNMAKPSDQVILGPGRMPGPNEVVVASYYGVLVELIWLKNGLWGFRVRGGGQEVCGLCNSTGIRGQERHVSPYPLLDQFRDLVLERQFDSGAFLWRKLLERRYYAAETQFPAWLAEWQKAM